MKIVVPCFAVLVGAALGLALGFSFRNLPVGRHSTQLVSIGLASNSSALSNDSSNARTKTVPLDDSPLATRLARDLSLSAGVTNWLCWWQALDQAMPSDFPRLLRLAKGNRLMTRMIAERWADLAPEHFLRTAIEAARSGNPLPWEVTNVLLDQWVKRDAVSLIAALKQTDDFPGRAEWRRQVASDIIATNTELGLQLMSQWHIENYGPNLKSVEAWAAADPRHAAQFTLANPAGYVSTTVIQAIGREWAKTAPADAMAFAIGQPGNLGSALATAALEAWASRDLNAASQWLSAAGPSVQNKLSPGFVEAWAKQDPASALAWCQSNMSGSALIQSVSSLFKGAADKDVRAAADLVLGMDPSPARAEAAAVVAGRWFPSFGGNEKSVPPDTMTWLNNLDSEAVARAVNAVQWQWADSDPSSMAAFLQSTNTAEISSFAFSNLARNMARSNPTEALDWANQLPEGRGITAGCAAFGEWGRSQPDVAMQWWSALPANDPRRQPFLQGLLSQLAWDTQANSQFAQIAANDPEAARKALANINLDAVRRDTLLSLISPR